MLCESAGLRSGHWPRIDGCSKDVVGKGVPYDLLLPGFSLQGHSSSLVS